MEALERLSNSLDKSNGKAAPVVVGASLNEVWTHAWQGGGGPLLELNPFDTSYPLEDQRSLVTYCAAPLGTLGPQQKLPLVVSCSECPQGYVLGESSLECRPAGFCDTRSCETCQIQRSNPFYTGACDACVSFGCDPNSNRCSCA